MAEPIKLNFQVETIDLEINEPNNIFKIPVGDELFIGRFRDFLKMVQDISKEANGIESDKMSIDEKIDLDIELHEKLKNGFTDVFGDGAYKQVFGDYLAGAEYVLEFINLILPYITEYQEKRSAKLEKYSANRVGSTV